MSYVAFSLVTTVVPIVLMLAAYRVGRIVSLNAHNDLAIKAERLARNVVCNAPHDAWCVSRKDPAVACDCVVAMGRAVLDAFERRVALREELER